MHIHNLPDDCILEILWKIVDYTDVRAFLCTNRRYSGFKARATIDINNLSDKWTECDYTETSMYSQNIVTCRKGISRVKMYIRSPHASKKRHMINQYNKETARQNIIRPHASIYLVLSTYDEKTDTWRVTNSGHDICVKFTFNRHSGLVEELSLVYSDSEPEIYRYGVKLDNQPKNINNILKKYHATCDNTIFDAVFGEYIMKVFQVLAVCYRELPGH